MRGYPWEKQEPPLPGPVLRKARPDALVEADTMGQRISTVAPTAYAKIGHFVDEADLNRQEGVGGIFDKFRPSRCPSSGRVPGRLTAVAHDALHHFGCLGCVDADHDPVGSRIVLIAAPSTRKNSDWDATADLGLGIEVRLGDIENLPVGANRHRRFGDDDRKAGDGSCDLGGSGKHTF